jgi:hypothetical protein
MSSKVYTGLIYCSPEVPILVIGDDGVVIRSEDVEGELPLVVPSVLMVVLVVGVEYCVVVVVRAVELDELTAVLDNVELEAVDDVRDVVVGDKDEDVDSTVLEAAGVVVGDGVVVVVVVVVDVNVVSVVLLLIVVVSVDTHISVSGMVHLKEPFIGAQVTLKDPLFPDCHVKPVTQSTFQRDESLVFWQMTVVLAKFSKFGNPGQASTPGVRIEHSQRLSRIYQNKMTIYLSKKSLPKVCF